jgi:hypothetical protein
MGGWGRHARTEGSHGVDSENPRRLSRVQLRRGWIASTTYQVSASTAATDDWKLIMGVVRSSGGGRLLHHPAGVMAIQAQS